MSAPRHLLLSDLKPLAQLGVDGVVGATDLTQAMHDRIAGGAGRIARLVYGSIRAIARLTGVTAEVAISALPERAATSSPEREKVVAALNGVLGDRLVETDNALALPMRLRLEGAPRDAPFAPPGDGASGRLLLMVHGLCLDDTSWAQPSGLARELGYTPVYVHYNSGLHISTNGRELARLLEELVSSWPVPVEELSILAHSMGGLVARSACHAAVEQNLSWPRVLRRVVFLGTPHQGAPLERLGSFVHGALGAAGHTAPLARLGGLRSAGITDLRHGSLLDTDWQGRDRFARNSERPRPVPLPAGVECFAIAASRRARPAGVTDRLVGDGLVPVPSALGDDGDPARALGLAADRRWIARRTGHLQLLRSVEVAAQVRSWLAAPLPAPGKHRAGPRGARSARAQRGGVESGLAPAD
jgi:hypothetical protein